MKTNIEHEMETTMLVTQGLWDNGESNVKENKG